MDAAARSIGGGAISGRTEVAAGAEAGTGTITTLDTCFCCVGASSACATDNQPKLPISTNKSRLFCKNFILSSDSLIEVRLVRCRMLTAKVSNPRDF